MALLTILPFSQSINGAGVRVVQTTSPGTLIHTASTVSGESDEVWMWAYNADPSANGLISIEWGGLELPRKVALPLQSLTSPGVIPVIPGWKLFNGATVRVFGSAANFVMIDGWVNRMKA